MDALKQEGDCKESEIKGALIGGLGFTKACLRAGVRAQDHKDPSPEFIAAGVREADLTKDWYSNNLTKEAPIKDVIAFLLRDLGSAMLADKHELGYAAYNEIRFYAMRLNKAK